MPTDYVKLITIIVVLFFTFIFIYSRYKRQTITQSIKEIKEAIEEIIGVNNE